MFKFWIEFSKLKCWFYKEFLLEVLHDFFIEKVGFKLKFGTKGGNKTGRGSENFEVMKCCS